MDSNRIHHNHHITNCFLCKSFLSSEERNNKSDKKLKYDKLLEILDFDHELPSALTSAQVGDTEPNCCTICVQAISELIDFHELIISFRLEMKEIVEKIKNSRILNESQLKVDSVEIKPIIIEDSIDLNLMTNKPSIIRPESVPVSCGNKDNNARTTETERMDYVLEEEETQPATVMDPLSFSHSELSKDVFETKESVVTLNSAIAIENFQIETTEIFGLGSSVAVSTSKTNPGHLISAKKPRWIACEFCSTFHKNINRYNRHLRVHLVSTNSDKYKTSPKSKRKYNNYHQKKKNKKPETEKVLIKRAKKERVRCDKCWLTFSLKADLKVHQRRVHDKILPYKCEPCGRAYARNSELLNHKRRAHAEHLFHCPKCNEGFKERRKMQKHLHQRLKSCLNAKRNPNVQTSKKIS